MMGKMFDNVKEWYDIKLETGRKAGPNSSVFDRKMVEKQDKDANETAVKKLEDPEGAKIFEKCKMEKYSLPTADSTKKMDVWTL